jgi:hypothetical protein
MEPQPVQPQPIQPVQSQSTPPPVINPQVLPQQPISEVPPVPKSKTKIYLYIFIPLLIFIVIGVAGYLLYKNSSIQKQSLAVNPIAEAQIVATIPPKTANCVISSDGLQTACVKRSEDAQLNTLVINEKEGETYDDIKELQFSPDGKTLAYIATKNEEVFAVVNNKREQSFGFVGRFVFSPDSKHYAYCVGKESYYDTSDQETRYKTISMAADGIQSKDYISTAYVNYFDTYCKPVFSPDSSNLAYSMVDNDSHLLIINNKEVFSSKDFFVGLPIFSADSSKIYFVPFKNDTEGSFGKPTLIDLSGNIIKTFDKQAYADPWKLALNNDLSKLLYEVQTSEKSVNSPLFFSDDLFINDDKVATNRIDYATLSPNGFQVAYTYTTSGTTINVLNNDTSPVAHVVVNNKEIENYKTFDTGISPIIFTQDDKYAMYISRTKADRLNYDPNKSKLVIVGDQKVCNILFMGTPFGSMAPLINGNNISFGYYRDQDLMWLSGKIDMDNCVLVN